MQTRSSLEESAELPSMTSPGLAGRSRSAGEVMELTEVGSGPPWRRHWPWWHGLVDGLVRPQPVVIEAGDRSEAGLVEDLDLPVAQP